MHYIKIINNFFVTRFTDDISIGDEVLVQGFDEMTPANVIDISSGTMKGDFVYYGFCTLE